MFSKPSSRRNSLKKTHSVALSQASSRSSVSTASSGNSSLSGAEEPQIDRSSRASSFSQKTGRSSRRSSIDSAKSVESTNESLFSSLSRVSSAKSTNSVNSVKSGVIPALYSELKGLEASRGSYLDVDAESVPRFVEEAAVHRSGRAGARQYGRQTMEKSVDPKGVHSLFAGYKQSNFLSLKGYKLRCKHNDPGRGVDTLVVDAGLGSGPFSIPTNVKHTYGKRFQERRDFSKVADRIGLRPRTLDSCDIKKVTVGSASVENEQRNALWNAVKNPGTFNEQVDTAALRMTGGITGLTGKATGRAIRGVKNSSRDINEQKGLVVLHDTCGKVYVSKSELPHGELRRKITRLPNKLREAEAGYGVGELEETLTMDDASEDEELKHGQYRVTRTKADTKAGHLPRSNRDLEKVLEGTWRKATRGKSSSSARGKGKP